MSMKKETYKLYLCKYEYTTMKVLFLIPYPIGYAPSQRFRFEQYFGLLRENNIEMDIQPFWDKRTWKVIYQKGSFFTKLLGITKGLIRRILILFRVSGYDFVFIHREIIPIGYPVIGWLIAKVFEKKIIYDFDDAIWIPNTSDTNKFFSFLKNYTSAAKLCSWAYKVSCGNEYLCDYARRFNNNVIYNPTTIDTENYHNKIRDHGSSDKFVIGWTGTHSTIQYLKVIVPVIEELEEKYDFELLVISDMKPDFTLRSLVYKQWNQETEIDDILLFSAGIMPLSDDSWANGKCGFKAIQYLALGIPALVSPVGVNTKIVDDRINGFICKTPEQWKENLEKLITNRELLNDLSQLRTGRQKVIDRYSVKSNADNFLNLFQ